MSPPMQRIAGDASIVESRGIVVLSGLYRTGYRSLSGLFYSPGFVPVLAL